jgi:predicted nucleic acid-binding protein
LIYLDSAAAVKLIHAEADSAALRDFLDDRAEIEWVSSTLLEIETYRALVRATAPADMPPVINEFQALLDLIVRIEID